MINGLRRRVARTPLWVRLVAGTLFLVALALVVTGIIGVRLFESYLVARVDSQLQATIRVAIRPPPGRAPNDQPRLRQLLGQFYAVVLDRAGTPVQTIATPAGEELPNLPRLDSAAATRLGNKPFTVGSASGDSRWRVIASPLVSGETRILAVKLDEVDRSVAQLVLIDVGVGGIVIACLALAGHLLVRRSLRPLDEVERTAKAIADGDLSRRVPARHPRTEMGRLGRAVNGMLAQIEWALAARQASEAAARSSEDRMRRFVADASHELRTPLTIIRGFAELYRQEGANDAVEAARLLRRIEDEASRMGLLVEDLLLLARLDQQRPLERAQVDMLNVAAEAVLDARALAPEREIELVRLDGQDGPVFTNGDEARLRQVLGNLVSNALTHTPAGTPVRVGLGRAPDGVALEVADEGPGLPPGGEDRVFERFYRADPSRSRMHGGSGLGLSIVVALVQAHGGSVEIDTKPGKGAIFRVFLPAKARPWSQGG